MFWLEKMDVSIPTLTSPTPTITTCYSLSFGQMTSVDHTRPIEIESSVKTIQAHSLEMAIDEEKLIY
jgi:hypothetical protein